jgi:hypothetical protein
MNTIDHVEAIREIIKLARSIQSVLVKAAGSSQITCARVPSQPFTQLTTVVGDEVYYHPPFSGQKGIDEISEELKPNDLALLNANCRTLLNAPDVQTDGYDQIQIPADGNNIILAKELSIVV